MSVAAAAIVLSFGAAALAGPTPDPKKQAAKEFTEGQKAFKDGDYRHAAEMFEAAYRDAPHPAALWNEARAWHRADEKTKAANLYAKYLRIAPPNARDRNSATEALKELSAQLARLEIHAVDMTDVKVDDQAVEDLSVYVTPGTHVIQATAAGDKIARKEQTVTAGSVVSIALVPPPVETKPPVDPNPPPQHDPDTTEKKSHGLSPGFVIAGAIVTGVGVGVTVWSGLDTVSAKKSFDDAPSQDGLDAGVRKQTRTNVFLAATIGAGALTAGLAFFTDWGGSKKSGEKTAGSSAKGVDARRSLKVGIGLGTITVKQSF